MTLSTNQNLKQNNLCIGKTKQNKNCKNPRSWGNYCYSHFKYDEVIDNVCSICKNDQINCEKLSCGCPIHVKCLIYWYDDDHCPIHKNKVYFSKQDFVQLTKIDCNLSKKKMNYVSIFYKNTKLQNHLIDKNDQRAVKDSLEAFWNFPTSNTDDEIDTILLDNVRHSNEMIKELKDREKYNLNSLLM